MTRGLIIGYGRAGKRHGKLLDELGVEWGVIEPDKMCIPPREAFLDLADALGSYSYHWDFAVIATPPALHLAQIRQCLDAGLSVLCEKPLCGLGQLAEAEALLEHPGADRVMVAYNWRFHSEIIKLRKSYELKPVKWTEFDFCQYRPSLPEWGLLLDHCSHDLDILSFITQKPITITEAEYGETSVYKIWEIVTDNAFIRDYVSNDETESRIGQIVTYPDNRIIDLDPDPTMYTAMWAAFLSGEYRPGLAEAVETQRLLERCWELAS